MQAPPSPATFVPSLRIAQFASATGWMLIALSASVLCGWAFDISALMSVVPGLAAMKANTAAAFLFAGLALVRREQRDLRFYSLGVLVIGSFSVIEYVANSSFGIDELVFRDPRSTILPGRMSQITGVAFTLLGPALVLLKAQRKTGRRISRALALAVGAVGIVALLGYSYDTQALYRVGPYSSVALPAAIGFVIAAVGVYCANPTEGFVRHTQANSAGGAMLRRLLPAALLIPYFLGLTAWIAHKRLGWEMGFSLAVVVAAVILCLVLILVLNAKRLDREELALRESEERFRLLANTAPVMIWMSGSDKKCDYFNERWLEFTGRALQNELGDGWAEGVHPEFRETCLETYVEAFDRRESFRMEYPLRRHDGEYRWISDIGVPRFNLDGSFAGYIGSCTDVTDHKLAEEALADVGRRLIEAQEAERTWIARELHDDITQRIALLSIELAKWELEVAAPASEALDLIRRIGERLLGISRDIRALSHRLYSSELECVGLVAAVDGFCKEQCEQQKVHIEFNHTAIPRDIPKETSLCIFRIVQEALQNAIKHSGVRKFTVALSGTAGEIEVTISDLGVGFDQQDLSKRYGLGLISMRERLQLVHGEFSIKSAPGRGTTIHGRIPLNAQSENRALARHA